MFIADILNEREKYWIKEFDTIVDHKKGYNLTYGGDSHGTWSLESRKKISESHKKIIHTPEWNKNVGNSKRGIPNPKVGISQKGIPCPSRGRPGNKKNSRMIRPIKATNKMSGEEIIFSRTCECCLYFIGDRENTWLIKKLASGSLPVYKTSRWHHLSEEWKFEYC